MKLHHPKFFLLIFLVFLGGCASGLENKKLIHREHDIALFSLELDKLDSQNAKLIQTPLNHPIREYTKENWKAILGNLKYTQSSSFGSFEYYVFAEEELDKVASRLVTALEKIDNTKILVVVLKQNEVKGVVSNDLRNTLVIFRNEEGIHLYFREIQARLQDMDVNNYYEWSIVPELMLYANYDKIQLTNNTYYQFKTIQGFENRLWAVVQESSIQDLKYEPRVSKEPTTITETKAKEKGKLPKSEIYIRRDLDLD